MENKFIKILFGEVSALYLNGELLEKVSEEGDIPPKFLKEIKIIQHG